MTPRYVLALLAIIPFVACKTKPRQDAPTLLLAATPTRPWAPGFFPTNAPILVTLERTGCYGHCPSYRISVHADGVVDYEGDNWVKTFGRAGIRIPSASVDGLLAAFEAADFTSSDPAYEWADDGCCDRRNDLSSALTSLTRNGVTKAVSHYHGNRNAPAELTKLENDIDQIVGIERLIGNPNERVPRKGR
jgi:hypothetical protein